MNSNPYCEIHKVEMVYKKGISKAGKNYEGYFCPEKKENGMNCDQVKWLGNKKSYAKLKPLIDDQQYQTILTALRETYKLLQEINGKINS